LKKIDAELRIVEEDIDKLQERKTTLLKRKQALKEKANEEATKVDIITNLFYFLYILICFSSLNIETC
jgi:hypothetical protein